jgi:predicted metal-dependent phosphoesterase TrpH
MRIDLHTHSSVSDGTESPAALVAAAVAAGLDIVALTDHDTFDGLPEALAAAASAGLRLVPGIEISTQFGGHSVHLLGYGCRPDDPGLAAELAAVRAGRSGRVPSMLAALARLGCPIDPVVLAETVGESPSIGRPHIADAMVRQGYVADRTEAFARYLDEAAPAFVPRYSIPLPLAVALVKSAGGVAVIAHPWGRGAAARLTPEALDGLAAAGLDGIEVDHLDHSAEQRRELRRIADELGLLATGASDYHGTGKIGHPLGLNLTAPEVLDEIDRRLAARG